MRALSAGFAILFLLCAVVQWNDPDPMQWMAIYGAAAVVSAVAARRRRVGWFWPAIVGAAAIVWSLTLAPALGKIAPGEIYATMKPGSPQIEESRETIGLFLVAAWMIVLAVHGARSRAPRTA